MSRSLNILAHGVFALLVLAGAAWSAMAIWLNLEPPMRIIALALLACAAGLTLVLRAKRRRFGWLAFAASALGVFFWYQTIQPRNDRNWAPDVAHGVSAEVDGQTVTLANIRDFDWETPTTAQERWITQRYNLDALERVDMFTSVWDNPDIAHLLVSFGFAGGEQVVFSVEIRREEGEVFNQVGGFFRQFELVLIAATERDIVRLRTDVRGETVRMFAVKLTPEQRQKMFLSYVMLAQQLEEEPRFYNTIVANCTTVVYTLARNLKSDLPWRRSLILSGRLPEYLDDLGVLEGDGPLEDRQNAALIPANLMDEYPHLSFSQAIRSYRNEAR